MIDKWQVFRQSSLIFSTRHASCRLTRIEGESVGSVKFYYSPIFDTFTKGFLHQAKDPLWLMMETTLQTRIHFLQAKCNFSPSPGTKRRLISSSFFFNYRRTSEAEQHHHRQQHSLGKFSIINNVMLKQHHRSLRLVAGRVEVDCKMLIKLLHGLLSYVIMILVCYWKQKKNAKKSL